MRIFATINIPTNQLDNFGKALTEMNGIIELTNAHHCWDQDYNIITGLNFTISAPNTQSIFKLGTLFTHHGGCPDALNI